MIKTLKSELIPLGIFCFFLALYLLSANQLFSFDAITNAIACESGEPVRWFHSNHPLYPFIGALWFKLERACGYAGYSIYSLARLNSLLMASALALLARALGRWIPPARAMLMSICLGCTYAVWAYAVDGRAIGASVFCSACVIVWMMKIERHTAPTLRLYVMLGALSALTVLMHGIAIFHCVPVAFWVFQKDRKKALAYIATSAILVGSVYAACYLYVAHANFSSSFVSWTLGYAAFNGAANAAQSSYWGKGAAIVLHGLWRGWRNALFASTVAPRFSVAAGVMSFLILCGYMAAWLRVMKERRKLSLPFALFSWGALMMAFLAFWSPGQEGFRLHILIPWSVALAICVGPARWIDWTLVVTAAILFTTNFCCGIYPASFIQNNTGYQVLDYIESRVLPGDVVLTGAEPTVPEIEVLRPYFFPDIKGGSILGRLFAFHEKSLAPLQNRLSELAAQGHSVYLAEDLFEEKNQRYLEEKAGLPSGSVASFVANFKITATMPLPNGRALRRVEFISR